MTVTPHNLHSSYRGVLIKQLFVGDLLRHLWNAGPILAEVLEPQVDDAGYDLVIQVGCVLRHIQLKSSHWNSSTFSQKVHLKLASKPSGCVIWIIFDENTLKAGSYLWFGAAPGEPLPDIGRFNIARHTKADSTGHKAERNMFRVVPKSKFEKLKLISQVAATLFGQEAIGKEKESV